MLTSSIITAAQEDTLGPRERAFVAELDLEQLNEVRVSCSHQQTSDTTSTLDHRRSGCGISVR
jgi:hypothetical protein